MTSRRAGSILERNFVFRVCAYYGVLSAIVLAIWWLAPDSLRLLLSKTLTDVSSSGKEFPFGAENPKHVLPIAQLPAAVEAGIASVGALLLSLPVAWVYMYTRQRKGYRRSLVQTLVLLPVVVAGVVVLVKNSLALAFGLAAIVAAVRFRNSLDDSRDAVFVFFATAIGLAAAVELDVAVVLSVLFNAVVLALFFTDFARTPPPLEGVRAQRHMERALAMANRTSEFVAQVDDSILQGMAPAQLDAMAERIRQRREQLGEDLPSAAPSQFDRKLRITATEAEGVRHAVEPELDLRVKRWRFTGSSQDSSGTVVLEYGIKLRKSISPHSLEQSLKDAGAPMVINVEVI